ncbi:MAG: hypothetical protein Kow0037_00130 [Calditrichia bacterium]
MNSLFFRMGLTLLCSLLLTQLILQPSPVFATPQTLLPGKTMTNQNFTAVYLYLALQPGKTLRNSLPVALRVLDAREMETLLKPLLIEAKLDSLNGQLNRLEQQIREVDVHLQNLRDNRQADSQNRKERP